MVYVFVFIVVGLAASHGAAAVLPPVGLSEAIEAAALRAPAAPSHITDPMDASAGHAMWDPIGRGCIDGGGWDDPFPTGKGTRAPVFCLSQPCARALTAEELSRDVVGRPLREGEWDRYFSRYVRGCLEDGIPTPEVVLSSLEAIADECAPVGAGSPTIFGSSARDASIPSRIRTCSTETAGRTPPPRLVWPELYPFLDPRDPASPPVVPSEPPIATPLPPTFFLLIAALIAPSALRGGRRIKQGRPLADA